jgi:hypothetical protein
VQPVRVRAGLAWEALYWSALVAALAAIKSAHVMESDEGLVLEGAWNLLNGRALYVDSFQIVTPGAFYAVYWAWKLFGSTYEVAQCLGIASIVLGAMAIYRTGLLLAGKSGWSYIGPALYVLASATWPAINHNSFNASLLAWALFFAIRALQKRSTPHLALSGLLTGLATLVIQHKGAAMLVAVAGYYAYRSLRDKDPHSRRALLVFVLAALLPLLSLLQWPLPVLFESLVVYPLLHYRDVNDTPFVPMAIAAGYLALAVGLSGVSSRSVQLLLVVQLLLLITTGQRSDLAHTFIVSFPLLALIPAMRPGCLRLRTATVVTRYVYASAAIAVVTYVASFAATHTWFAWRLAGLGGGVMAYVRQACNSIYAGPFLPGMYYEARKLNPTSYPYLLTGFNSRAQFEQATLQLNRAMPQCVVVNYGMASRFGYSRDNEVDRFIETRYAPVLAEAGVIVYAPRGADTHRDTSARN